MAEKQIRYIGIDAGLNGAFAVFDSNKKLITVIDMPIKYEGKYVSLDIYAIHRLVERLFNEYNPMFFLEYPTFSRKVEDNTYMAFKYGVNLGVIESAIRINEIIHSHYFTLAKIKVIRWKNHFGLINKDKTISCITASNKCPLFKDRFMSPFKDSSRYKYYDGRAEATLIGLYGIESDTICK